ncbi:hypothetical protein FSP39_023386 [Pinctada imbricata]|uniref:FLYWCH-type domain-containing protein n=1 Tax=Pinctada imbricata TaxID=66713 RepID=A0AA88YG07_PINIB|nr:hypothetical protein FSP39_023386 [Pinctada imbricata]
MSSLCVECNQECRPRQQSLECDLCSSRQHRTCNTNITQEQYRAMKRREIELPFTCSRCRLPIPDRSPLQDDIENVLAPPAKRRRRKIPKIKKSKPKHQPLQPPSPTPLPSTPLLSSIHIDDDDDDFPPPPLPLDVLDQDDSYPDVDVSLPPPPTPLISSTQPMDHSLTRPMDQTSTQPTNSMDHSATRPMDQTSTQLTNSMDHSPTRPMDQTSTQPTHSMDHSPTHSMDHSPADNSFDVSVLINPTNPINESDIQQNGRNDTILDDEPVTYEIVEKGSKQRAKKLVSSDGYAYTVKKTTQYATYWRCSVRSSTLWCRASVTQRGTTFTPGKIFR